jgi:ATP-dependent RNA helicase RhlE
VSIKFSELPIIPEIQSALKSLEYHTPTPIQAGAIPPLLDGKDLLGCAQTGTGKTAAFAIPILQKIHELGQYPRPYQPLGLIVAPTRELVVQISENISAIGRHLKVRQAQIYGGVGQRPQVAALAKGVHLLVATPGRLLDLIDQEYCTLSKLQFFVLDEADRMLDMGFLPDVQKIVRMLPRRRQSVFLSATMPAPIENLAATLLHQHVTVMVTPPAKTADRVEQAVMFVNRANKRKLFDQLLEDPSRTRVLVFMRTKHGADRLYKSLVHAGVSAEGIHGGRSQNARQRVLNAFRNGEIRVLIATDVAARGIDIDDISHVINFDVPVEAESYVHRIGRTARAGASGRSITLCDGDELKYLREIEKTIGMPIPVDRNHPFHSVDAEDAELQNYGRGAKTKSSRGTQRGAAPRGRRVKSRSGDTPEGAQTPSQATRAAGPSRRRTSEQPSERSDGAAVTKRRRSISGKTKKIKLRSTSGTSQSFGKRPRPKSKRH